MAAVRSLKPNVSREEAIARFSPRGLAGTLRNLRQGPLRSVADVYVPFRLYQVEIANRSARQTSWFALDAVNGLLDLYQFEHLPEEAELVQVETRNRPAPRLDDAEAERLLGDKLRRIIFQMGFFRIRNLSFRPQLVPLDLHVPYWVGCYGARETVRLRVMDAVRRRIEGAKARAFFHSWLAS